MTGALLAQVCCKCREEKAASEFSRKSDCLDGLNSRCRMCVNTARRARARQLAVDAGNALPMFCKGCDMMKPGASQSACTQWIFLELRWCAEWTWHKPEQPDFLCLSRPGSAAAVSSEVLHAPAWEPVFLVRQRHFAKRAALAHAGASGPSGRRVTTHILPYAAKEFPQWLEGVAGSEGVCNACSGDISTGQQAVLSGEPGVKLPPPPNPVK